MRLAGHTYAFRSLPLEAALEAVARLGFAHAEVWLGHAVEGPDRVARALEASGLGVVAVGAGGFYDDDPRPVDAAFRLAAALGAPGVVACVEPAVLPVVARRIPPRLALWVENHWDQSLARVGEVARALDGVAPPRGASLGACLDTGHALMAGADPVRFAERLGPRLRHVHLKDARRASLPERALGRRVRRRMLRPAPVAPGRGALDPVAVLAALARAGFAGAVSFEHEGDQPEAALAELRRLAGARADADAARPGGSLPSNAAARAGASPPGTAAHP